MLGRELCVGADNRDVPDVSQVKQIEACSKSLCLGSLRAQVESQIKCSGFEQLPQTVVVVW